VDYALMRVFLGCVAWITVEYFSRQSLLLRCARPGWETVVKQALLPEGFMVCGDTHWRGRMQAFPSLLPLTGSN